MYLLTHVISLLHQGYGKDDRLLAVTVQVDTARLKVNTNHTVINRIHTNQLTTGVTTSGEECLIHLLTQHTHFTALLQVHVVQVTAIVHLGLHDLRIVRGHTTHIT